MTDKIEEHDDLTDKQKQVVQDVLGDHVLELDEAVYVRVNRVKNKHITVNARTDGDGVCLTDGPRKYGANWIHRTDDGRTIYEFMHHGVHYSFNFVPGAARGGRR